MKRLAILFAFLCLSVPSFAAEANEGIGASINRVLKNASVAVKGGAKKLSRAIKPDKKKQAEASKKK